MARTRHKVICVYCHWTGRRAGLECACYDEYAYYCRPWSPGPGCPSSILYGCPKCGKRTVTVVFSLRGMKKHAKDSEESWKAYSKTKHGKKLIEMG